MLHGILQAELYASDSTFLTFQHFQPEVTYHNNKIKVTPDSTAQ